MDYSEFLKQKKKSHVDSGFEVSESDLNANLFDFQKHIVRIALKKGRFAIFADCGLGKTLMQLDWAHQVVSHTNKPVIVLAPLAVVDQTIEEGKKFNIECFKISSLTTGENPLNSIYIVNYDQLKNIDVSKFSGVVLDESSILKGRDSKTKTSLIESFKTTPYKLCCTATPSPNDHMELGNHSEFMGAMTYLEMLSMFFVHDGGETSKWRLRKHAHDTFWQYVCTWSISLDNPITLGFNSDGYELPEINYIEHIIQTNKDDGLLFRDGVVSATNLNQDLRMTQDVRIEKALSILDEITSDGRQCIVWGLQNVECDNFTKSFSERFSHLKAFNIQGSDKPQVKADRLLGFAHKDYNVLVTKTSIASFGMNYQQCSDMVFLSYDFKFEAFYQAVRRCYRFGQSNTVNIHILIPDTQMNVRKTILEKESKHKEMIHHMSKYSAETDYTMNVNQLVDNKTIESEDYKIMNGDCVDRIKDIPSESVGLTIFSPPFAELYVYSDKKEDMGNVSNYNQFKDHFSFLVPELNRVMKQGRIVAVHCMDLPIQKGKEGFIGLRDFSGMLIDVFRDNGFIYHARTTIWKNPVTEMQRTKALGLLHKTIKKDSSMSRVGIPDYILFFRKEGDNLDPITHQDTDSSKADFLPVDLWQKYASPVWYDIDYSRTLNYRSGRDGNDEKHICPLQLDTINRILHLYSNEGDTVLTPFMGVGSEVYESVKMSRKGIGIELKESYFNLAKDNVMRAVEESKQLTLF